MTRGNGTYFEHEEQHQQHEHRVQEEDSLQNKVDRKRAELCVA